MELREALESAMDEVKAKTDDAPQEPTVDEKIVEAPEAVEEKVAEEPAAPVKTYEAPEAWSAENKAEFNKLPPNIQAQVIKREKDIEKAMTRGDGELAMGRQFKEIVMPYMAGIQAEGSNALDAVKSLLNTAHVLRTADPQQKLNLFAQIAKQYGVPLENVVNSTQNRIDPALETLQQRLDRLERERSEEALIRQQEEQARIEATIDAFRNDPAHSLFEEVRSEMGQLLNAGLAKDMKDAYEKAINLRPDLRPVAQAKTVEQIQNKALTAKKAAGSIKGAPSGAAANSAANSDKTLREELEASLQSARGRI